MAEQQKKDFIQSLKRLTVFFNQIKTYKPDEQTIKAHDFLKKDMSQQYKIFEYKNPAETEEQKFQAINELKIQNEMDQKVLKLLEEANVPDEQFI